MNIEEKLMDIIDNVTPHHKDPHHMTVLEAAREITLLYSEREKVAVEALSKTVDRLNNFLETLDNGNFDAAFVAQAAIQHIKQTLAESQDAIKKLRGRCE